MKEWLGAIIFAGILVLDSSAAGSGPEVTNVDQKISISADDITLDRLLRLWDQATRMQSVVSPELANYKLSVHFTGLDVNDALRKMFAGQSFDYVLVPDRGISIMSRSQSEPVAEAAGGGNDIAQPGEVDNDVAQPPEADNPAEAQNDVEVTQPPVSPGSPSSIVQPPGQPPVQPPAVIATPFGPIVNPYGTQQPVIQLPPVYGPAAPPFFAATVPPVPPAGAPNGPVQNMLFGPLPVYHDPLIMGVRP